MGVKTVSNLGAIGEKKGDDDVILIEDQRYQKIKDTEINNKIEAAYEESEKNQANGEVYFEVDQDLYQVKFSLSKDIKVGQARK